MKILLINQGYSDNLGDKAIKYMLSNLLKKLGHQVEFCGFTQFEEQSLKYMNKTNSTQNIIFSKIKNVLPLELKWKLKENKLKKMLKNKENNFDFIIIGGGQLVKSKCYFPYAMQFWINYANKIDSEVALFGIGCDQNLTKREKKIYNEAFNKCKNITVRDKFSKNFIVKEFEIECSWVPDVAFFLSNYLNQNRKRKKNDVVVMIYNYMTYKNHFEHKISKTEYYDRWVEMIKQNINIDSYIKLAYSTYEDKIETYHFVDYLKEKIDNKIVIANSDTIANLFRTLMCSEKIITGRMHPMIFGILANCEIIPYFVSNKIEIFKKEWLLHTKDINFKYMNKIILNKLNEIIG